VLWPVGARHSHEGFVSRSSCSVPSELHSGIHGLRELEGSAPLQVDGFEVGWRDDRGEHRRSLEDAVSVAFEEGRPVRGFPSYRGQRHFPGLYWSATTGGHVGFESWL
jgi:hypothetical protein